MATLKEIEKNRIIKAEATLEKSKLVFSSPKDYSVNKGDLIRVLASAGKKSGKALRFTYSTAKVEKKLPGKVEIVLPKPLDDRLDYEVEIPSIGERIGTPHLGNTSERRVRRIKKTNTKKEMKTSK